MIEAIGCIRPGGWPGGEGWRRERWRLVYLVLIVQAKEPAVPEDHHISITSIKSLTNVFTVKVHLLHFITRTKNDQLIVDGANLTKTGSSTQKYGKQMRLEQQFITRVRVSHSACDTLLWHEGQVG